MKHIKENKHSCVCPGIFPFDAMSLLNFVLQMRLISFSLKSHHLTHDMVCHLERTNNERQYLYEQTTPRGMLSKKLQSSTADTISVGNTVFSAMQKRINSFNACSDFFTYTKHRRYASCPQQRTTLALQTLPPTMHCGCQQ